MTAKLDQTIALALELSPSEQAQLLQEIAAHLASQLGSATTPHWGQNLVNLLNSLDLSAWDQEPIDDPVAWVKQQRASATRELNWEVVTSSDLR